ncbi:MAG: hypothetical protein E6614_05855, partial [Bradyrhizobium sp.]|nr:hypothetical protein [Bradyrhizobium sp.]
MPVRALGPWTASLTLAMTELVGLPVPATAAYGVCWAVPFLWCALWGAISVWWCKRDMVRERLEWEADTTGMLGGRTAAGADADADSAATDAAMWEAKEEASPARSETAGTGGSG